DVLHALDRTTGTERWSHPFGQGSSSGPSVADGSVYVFAGDQRDVISIDAATGTERWRTTSTTADWTQPTFGAGKLFANTDSGDLVALDPATGAEFWHSAVSLTGAGVGSPAFADGVVYAASQTGGLVALDANQGMLLWRADTGSDTTGTVVV